jgi:hypothetical protein
MITRRCSERRFFLRPDGDTNDAFIYCLGLVAKRANVQVTFPVAMSNHHHTGMPEVVSIEISRPHGFENLGQSEWASLVTDRVRAKEADHRQRRAAQGITRIGRDGILRQDLEGSGNCCVACAIDLLSLGS